MRTVEDLKEAEPEANERAPRLVYTQAPVVLGRLVERVAADEWRVDVGPSIQSLPVDPCVDPALLDEVAAAGARVVVDCSGEPTIVGVISTSRALTIDSEDRVRASVTSFELTAKERFLLRTPGAFIQAAAEEIEIYGVRVLTRARNTAKILAAMIKLN